MRVLTPTFPERGIHAGLADRALVRSEIYIAGEWRKANDGGLLSVRNPATGEWIGSVAAAGPDETVATIAAAKHAWPGWRALTPDARVCGELRFRRHRAGDTARGSEIATDSR